MKTRRVFGRRLGRLPAALLAAACLAVTGPPWSTASGLPMVKGAQPDGQSSHSSASAPVALTDGFKMPLRFEENAGQASPGVKFLIRGAGAPGVLTAREAVMGSGSFTVRLRLVGANPAPEVSG
ncbi:MAG: hypothetical protein ACRDIU_06775, partial [Actinomycetota bacterium]